MRLEAAVAGMRGSTERIRILGSGDVDVTGVTLDSRAVRPGDVFCCVPGSMTDGHRFAGRAVEAGAAALMVERVLDLDVPQVVCDDVREALGFAAASLHGHPSDVLKMVGVTGTNGKTTVSNVIGAVLNATGTPTRVIGTLSGTRTTPEATELQPMLADAAAAGQRAVAMEVSSHALQLHRVNGCVFDVAVFTNLGRDHLDLHGTQERYFAAKAALFAASLSRHAVVNVDDVHGRLLADTIEIPTIRYSAADAEAVSVTASSVSFRFRGQQFQLNIGGRFNVSNALAAIHAASLLGVDDAVIAAGLAASAPVPGRFEPVNAGQAFTAVVDYAHTPDGLTVALGAARETAGRNRVIVVFGCGGDRDRDKRSEMGMVAAELADMVVVTSDNPRGEEPLAIIASVLSGVPAGYRQRALVEPDRRSAIAVALQAAAPGDVVLVAGKGHETTQTVGNETLPFDDRAVVRELLENMS